MSQRRIWELFRQTRAIRENDHFVYDSGYHGSTYVDKYALLQDPEIASELCEELADEFVTKGIEVVVGNAKGGIIVAQWVAHHLNAFRKPDPYGNKKSIVAIFAEEEVKAGGKKTRVLRHGFGDTVRGRRVLLVDDVVTTGSSLSLLSDAVEEKGGYVAGVGVLCARGTVKSIGRRELVGLVMLELGMYVPSQCPFCMNKVPINIEFGSGREFLEKPP